MRFKTGQFKLKRTRLLYTNWKFAFRLTFLWTCSPQPNENQTKSLIFCISLNNSPNALFFDLLKKNQQAMSLTLAARTF